MWDILKDNILVSVSYTSVLVNFAGLFSEDGVSVSHSVMSDAVASDTVAHQAPLSMEFSRQE